METDSKDQRLKFISETVHNGLITVYKIAKGTGLKQTTIWNMVNGKTKLPHEKSLDLIYDFLYMNGIKDNNNSMKVATDDAFGGEGTIDRIIEDKIRKVVKEMISEHTDMKFSELNEHILYMMRSISALEKKIEEKNNDQMESV